MRFKKIVFLTIIIALVLGSGPGQSGPFKKYIDPPPDYSSLQEQIARYLESQPGTYGLYFIDLKSGTEFGYNSTMSFHAASTFKLPMNLYLYLMASRGRLSLDEQLTYEERHLEGGTGKLKNDPPGSVYSVQQLARYSIVYSDNVATNILLERLGKKNVKDFMRSLGGKVVDDEKNITCPYDLALYMRDTLEFSRSGKANAGLLLNDLFNAEYKDRIPAPLPAGIPTANKIGTWPPTNTYNDVAYVKHPQRPYILVMTSKETPGYGETLPVFHHISKMVYDFQTKPPPKQQ